MVHSEQRFEFSVTGSMGTGRGRYWTWQINGGRLIGLNAVALHYR